MNGDIVRVYCTGQQTKANTVDLILKSRWLEIGYFLVNIVFVTLPGVNFHILRCWAVDLRYESHSGNDKDCKIAAVWLSNEEPEMISTMAHKNLNLSESQN